ncbi:DUF6430 domain-containing protein [Agromyces allii]|uniref:DUF6430 domain-containing protein n=1 Tax=Agromyces allii TaxID=393607 RepID=A0ABP5CL66_9MICO
MNHLKRWRFWRRFFVSLFAALGVFSAVAGLVSLFVGTLEAEQAWVVWPCLIIAIGFGLWRAWPRPVEAAFSAPNTTIKVVRGDLFEQDTHLVVGTCDTFDMRSPQISPRSVQGIYLSRKWRGDADGLDAAIDVHLAKLVSIGTVAKTGRTARFELGTVVPLESHGTRDFFVAYTSMDVHNKAHGTADGLWLSLGNLWASVRRHSNGEALSIPVLGGGQSGLSPVLPAEDAIRFIALSYIIAARQSPVCHELRIVALPELYDRLNHLELQAFLSGLARA